MKRLLIAALLLVGVSFAYAQSPVTTQPYATTSISNASATIGVTNTFQTVLPDATSTTGRVDCLIQNLSARSMFLSFEATPTLTTNALTLAAGTTFRCANSGVVIRNKISITGTAADNYFAIQE